MVAVVLAAATAFLSPQSAATEYHSKSIKASGQYWSVAARYPFFPQRTVIAGAASRAIEEDVKKEIAETKKQMTEQIKDLGKPSANLEMDLTSSVYTVGPALISASTSNYWYTGGAHPNTNIKTYNFGFVAGKVKKLTLRDLVKPGVSPAQFVEKYLLRGLSAEKMKRDADRVVEIDKRYYDAFVITKAGLKWIFEPYAVGAYAEGMYTVELPFSEIRGDLNPDGPLHSFLVDDLARSKNRAKG